MSRYYFDLKDGGYEPDDVGTELPGERAAQREAIRFAGEVLKDEPHRLEHGPMRVDVRDDGRSVRFRVVVSLETA